MREHLITRVWGTADAFDIEFEYVNGTRWICSIPPDTVDGAYAVDIYAENDIGNTAHWAGELFMASGVCHLDIFEPEYTVWFGTNFNNIQFLQIMTYCNISDELSAPQIEFSDCTSIIISKGCPHK